MVEPTEKRWILPPVLQSCCYPVTGSGSRQLFPSPATAHNLYRYAVSNPRKLSTPLCCVSLEVMSSKAQGCVARGHAVCPHAPPEQPEDGVRSEAGTRAEARGRGVASVAPAPRLSRWGRAWGRRAVKDSISSGEIQETNVVCATLSLVDDFSSGEPETESPAPALKVFCRHDKVKAFSSGGEP